MKDIKAVFDTILSKNRLSHLYLFVGSQGDAKKHLAYEIATKIIEKDAKDLKHIEQQIKTENHPNLFYIGKDGDSIKKEQILSLQKEFSKTSLVEGPRVYIINGVDSLTVSAANSLLKFMEEPQSDITVGILLTDQQDKVLKTIISRSQVMIIPSDVNFVSLLQLESIDHEDSVLLSFLTEDITEAKTLLENPFYLQTKTLIKEFIEGLFNKETSLVLLLKEKGHFLYQDKMWYALFLNVLLRYYVDVNQVKLMEKPILEFLLPYIDVDASRLSVKKCDKIISEIQKLISKIPYYINLELGLEVLCFELEKNR